jgi:hypothetical protein
VSPGEARNERKSKDPEEWSSAIWIQGILFHAFSLYSPHCREIIEKGFLVEIP